jgi:hypothetical protein
MYWIGLLLFVVVAFGAGYLVGSNTKPHAAVLRFMRRFGVAE